MDGYIALWRKIQDHDFYKEKRVYSKFEAWIDILFEVQFYEKPKQVTFGMTVLTRYYGESLKSVRTWASRWSWGTGKTHKFLKMLQKMEQIRYTNETVTSRISVLNYSKYDLKKLDGGTQRERKENASGTQAERNRIHSKKEKKVNKKELPKKEPSRLPDIDEIEDIALPKIKSDLDNICQKFYNEKIFIKVHAFRNTMLKAHRNDRAILHALSRCYLKNTLKSFKNDSEAWAYCLKIIQAEDGNYNEKDHNKTN